MIDDLEDIIKNDRESTLLDFKREYYSKSKKEDLIKDLMSFANAHRSGEKFIVCGVDYKTNGEREIVGINASFPDSATIQQLINENIEPTLNFEFFEFEIESKKVWIFRVYDNNNPPYLMRKDFGKLKKGDGFIRRGDSTDKLVRADFDKYTKVSSSNNFDPSIEIGFGNDHSCKEIELEVLQDFKFPSEIEKERLKKLVEERKEIENKKITQNDILNASPEKKRLLEAAYSMQQFQVIPRIRIPGFTAEEQMTSDELSEKLEMVDENFYDDDCFTLFELNSHIVNICILNSSENYIENASVKIETKKLDGFLVSDKIYTDTRKSGYLTSIENLTAFYPSVKTGGNLYIIENDVGEIRHHIPVNIFSEGLRIVLGKQILGQEILLKVYLYGKNLPKPLERELIIKSILSTS